ncbi:MAG: hypothetical protein P4K80_05340 [Acidobacteriaceae bacterium]|nr:hypothetical protein [Acidobacteriaceae bacterium]
MTQLEAQYRYGVTPSESVVLALSKIRDVYGIRRVELCEAEKSICVEYDASRLSAAVIDKLLRRAGLDIVETIALTAPVEEPVASVA